MTEEEIQKYKEEIDKLTHEDMARMWRFARPGHPYFQHGPIYDYFQKRFDSFGNWNPRLSKKIGWGA